MRLPGPRFRPRDGARPSRIESDLNKQDRVTRYGGLPTTGGGSAPRPARSLSASPQPRILPLRLSPRRSSGNTAHSFRATLFDKSAVSNWLVAWLQDTALPLDRRVDDSSWGPWSVKDGVLHAIAPASARATIVALRVHLDDSTLPNGPLRVLPGTTLAECSHASRFSRSVALSGLLRVWPQQASRGDAAIGRARVVESE